MHQAPPEILYHYTSLETMTKIIAGEAIFATSIHYLNDSTEWLHARNMLLKRATRIRKRHSRGHDATALDWLIRYPSSPNALNVYVSSFSEKSDDLSQWRGYTRPGQGVCIGFSGKALNEIASSFQASEDGTRPATFSALGKIIYTTPQAYRAFDHILSLAPSCVDIVDGHVVRAWIDLIVDQNAPFYKVSSFADEAEWRMSFVENSHLDMPLPQKFRVGSTMLIPYVEVSLRGRMLELIKHIVIGPTPHKELSTRAVKQFLITAQLPHVPVNASSVPFRNW